jgi:hypothetical protein
MDPELARIRDDLDIIRRATGLEPAWDGNAIRTHVLLAAAGIAAALWAALPHELPPILGLLAFILPVIDWGRQIKPAAGRTATEAREVRDAIAVLWYVLPLASLGLWGRLVGLDALTMAGLMWFMLGLVLFGPALTERGLRPLLAWAVSFMAGGLLLPLKLGPFVPVFAGMLAAGAVAAALLIAIELRRPGTA